MPKGPPPVVSRYFEHDANRDIEAIVALFTDDATVIDEGVTRRGIRDIRDWQTGAASKYQYTATVTGGEPTGPDSYRALARLDGNFPGNTVALKFDFTIKGERIHHLKIAPTPREWSQ
jgi:hypothetical protein